MFNDKLIKADGTLGNHSLILSQPGVSHNGPEDRGQVAESHKSVIYGGGHVIVPMQEVPKVQHQDSCGQAGTRHDMSNQSSTLHDKIYNLKNNHMVMVWKQFSYSHLACHSRRTSHRTHSQQ